VEWSVTRFREVVEKLKIFLKHAGFRVSCAIFFLFASYFLDLLATRIQISAIFPALA
jgi:hypothetical protein